eukprot:1071627-Pleurochrysis_carterae.AAC.2
MNRSKLQLVQRTDSYTKGHPAEPLVYLVARNACVRASFLLVNPREQEVNPWASQSNVKNVVISTEHKSLCELSSRAAQHSHNTVRLFGVRSVYPFELVSDRVRDAHLRSAACVAVCRRAAAADIGDVQA